MKGVRHQNSPKNFQLVLCNSGSYWTISDRKSTKHIGFRIEINHWNILFKSMMWCVLAVLGPIVDEMYRDHVLTLYVEIIFMLLVLFLFGKPLTFIAMLLFRH